MNIKKIIIILSFFLLMGCGYEPIYSKKKLEKNNNFSITNIEFEESSEINQILLNNLKMFMNLKNKLKLLNLKIKSSTARTTVSKNKKGNAERYLIEVNVNVNVFENEILKKQFIFKESFNYNSQTNKFNLNQYEKNIKENLISKISDNIILELYSLQ
tara:strand:+ start:288 stop:761 length:474 start_codon:yes stop_codon:yes gene_type:complete